MWDPGAYAEFGEHRLRPWHDLMARVGAALPRRVVDVGCGPGDATVLLAARWPGATLEAFDSSPEMVSAARARGVDARVRDLRQWLPASDTDVLVSNAVLQWVPEHVELLKAWVRVLPGGGWLAVQVPGNFTAPSHTLIRELAAQPRWAPRLAGVLRGAETVHPVRHYAELLTAAGCAVDAWETSYLQRLDSADPVLAWVTGTALRPVRAALDDDAWARFRAELAPMLRDAYPPGSDGATWLPFRRVFVVAQVGGGGR